MSGHNKWSKIKRGKESKDMARGNVFSKLSRLITLAVIEGGGITDVSNNVKLRLAVDKAKQYNMPKDNIARAIERAIGPDKTQLQEIVYEAFAPAGVGLIILATSDNPKRTLAEIRNVLERYQGKLANLGAVSYLFKRCGLVIFEKNKIQQDEVLNFAEKINAFDIEEDEFNFLVYLPFEHLGKVDEFLKGIESHPAEITYKPNSLIVVPDKVSVEKIEALVKALEELNDVHKVFTNHEKNQTLNQSI